MKKIILISYAKMLNFSVSDHCTYVKID